MYYVVHGQAGPVADRREGLDQVGGRIGTGFNVLALHPGVPTRTVPELIAYALQNPGKLHFGFRVLLMPGVRA